MNSAFAESQSWINYFSLPDCAFAELVKNITEESIIDWMISVVLYLFIVEGFNYNIHIKTLLFPLS